MSIFDVTITARNLPRLIKMGMAEEIVKNIDALEAENARLKAEVERLRKHGDAMAETLEGAGFDSAMDFWNAAKEGKLP